MKFSIIIPVYNAEGSLKASLDSLQAQVFRDVEVAAGRSVTRLAPFRFRNRSEGCRFIVYTLR